MRVENVLDSKRFFDFFLFFQVDAAAKVKISSIFLSCFNVSPEFASAFKFKKSRGQGEFTVKYMLAAFDKEAWSGEFFIEFDECVYEHLLVECFKSQGAGQVTTITFPNNDKDESAANALVCIMTSQKKHGDGYTRGICNPTLYTKVHAKMEEAHRQELLGAKEFDEKTAAGIKLSLETQAVKLESIEDGVQAHAVKLEAIGDGVQAQTVDLVDIKQGVCNVIPDYQNEIKALKDALGKKTAACDTIEGRLAHKTRIINQQDAYIANLEKDKQAWSEAKADMQNKYSLLQEEFNMFRTLRQMIDTLSSTLAEERAAKRPRA